MQHLLHWNRILQYVLHVGVVVVDKSVGLHRVPDRQRCCMMRVAVSSTGKIVCVSIGWLLRNRMNSSNSRSRGRAADTVAVLVVGHISLNLPTYVFSTCNT